MPSFLSACDRAMQNKVVQLLIGIVGIYTCYGLSGYYQQKILKRPYDVEYLEWITFDFPITVMMVQNMLAWILGFLINNLFYSEHTKMPASNLIACAIVVIVSTHTYVLAIYITNFPIVMMVKSCNIISVVFVGIFCSRVRDKALNLGPKKIIVAVAITLGILMYNLGGNSNHVNKATDVMGVILLIISLVADGFLPDFQAVIKSEYNPRPIEMFEHINKWVTILCFTYSLTTGQIFKSYTFVERYPQFIKDLLILSVLTSIGQMFVYRLIKQFKQHIVPFVITTRKLFTVVISIILFGHQTTFIQGFAIVLVFISASYEYLSEIYLQKNKAAMILPQQQDASMSERKGLGQKWENQTTQDNLDNKGVIKN